MTGNSLDFLVPVSGVVLAIVAVAGGITYSILKAYFRAKTDWSEAAGTADLRRALDENTSVLTAVRTRLDQIETRLGGVEKTLTDIP